VQRLGPETLTARQAQAPGRLSEWHEELRF
jgi:hypothetical protein